LGANVVQAAQLQHVIGTTPTVTLAPASSG
jgi:hypothetical protein